MIVSAILFGAIATVCTGFLFTLRDTSPADGRRDNGFRARSREHGAGCAGPAAAHVDGVYRAARRGASPCSLIMRSNGWIIQKSTPIELALLVLALVAVVLGFRAMILVSSRSRIRCTRSSTRWPRSSAARSTGRIDVYEWSEIGQLQSGFNRMVAGLREREQLRDLFGRHVGEEVVRRAVDDDESLSGDSLSGDERNVAILFIDLVGSTQLAATHEPHEVAAVLNEFFRMVVDQVDRHDGLINKFQGDAALAVFGAPLRTTDPAVGRTVHRAHAGCRTAHDSQWISASGYLRARCSPATSARRTATSTPSSATPSTRPPDSPTAPRTSTDACCVRAPRSSRRLMPNAGAGVPTGRRCCAAAPPRRTSQIPVHAGQAAG